MRGGASVTTFGNTHRSLTLCLNRFTRVVLPVLISLVVILLLPWEVHCEKYEGTPIVQKDARGKIKRYKTSLGYLEASMLLLSGSQIIRTGNKMEFKEGYFAIGSQGSVSIENPVPIYRGKPHQRLTPLLITFVQDLASQNWLATNGLLYVRKHQGYLLEGQRVTVIGGKNNPLIIDGQPFADTALVILNGKPVRKTN